MHLRAVFTLLRQDWTVATRDNIVLYMLVSPLLLALGARLLLPSLEATNLRYAADAALGPELLAELETLGDVERLDGAAAVRERVGRADDVPGIIRDESGTLTVILEGNEAEGAALADLLMATLLQDGAAATILVEQFRAPRSQLTEYTAVMLAMLGVLIGGMTAGFVMVDEKETGAVRALAVSPLTVGQYTAARSLFGLLISAFVAMVGSLILVGSGVNYAGLLLACLIAAAVGMLLGYLLAGFAANQLEAIALVKVLMFLFLTVPVATIFVPARWQIFFYWLPNYWMFKNFETLFVGQVGPVPFWAGCLLTVGVSALYLAALLPRLRRTIRLRYA